MVGMLIADLNNMGEKSWCTHLAGHASQAKHCAEVAVPTMLGRDAAFVHGGVLVHKRLDAVQDFLAVAGHRDVQVEVAIADVPVRNHLCFREGSQPLARGLHQPVDLLHWETEVILVDWPCKRTMTSMA